MSGGQEFGDRRQAVIVAEQGAEAWRAVVHAQMAATPDHADFYALAGSVVDTLAALASVARLLGRQVAGYPATVAGSGEGFVLYDDSRSGPAPVVPVARLAAAEVELAELALILARGAMGNANAFWNEIGHVGVEPAAPQVGDDGADGEVSR